METAPRSGPKGGRPRKLDPAVERRRLIGAAQRLMREVGCRNVSVGAVLAASGLSTAAFYRHFASKDELLVSIYLVNGQELGRILAERVATTAVGKEVLL